MEMKIKYLRAGAKKPVFATAGSAGMDLSACIDEDIVLSPGERRGIPTGIAVSVPRGYGGFVFARSGLASKYGITMSNGVGVIDSDYTGELILLMINLSDESFTVKNGDRIAQLIIMNVYQPEIVPVSEFGETARGVGGFGSTGI